MTGGPTAFERVIAAWGFDGRPRTSSVASVPTGRRASGHELRLAAHLCVGTGPGPVLAVLCGTHGDETYGVDWSRHLVHRLASLDFAGAVLCVPVANVLAFESATRTTGQGMNADNTNLNRVFPGNPDGAFNEQLAVTITEKVLGCCDALIDVHTGGLETVVDYVLVEQGEDEHARVGAQMSRALGSRYLFASEGPAYSGTASGAARALGVPTTIAEFGGTAHTDPCHRDRTLEGVRGVMALLGMCKAGRAKVETQTVLHARVIARAHTGGFFRPTLTVDDLGDTVASGTVLGEIYHPETFEVLETVIAPYETSVLLLLRVVPGRINAGEFVAMVGDLDSGEPLA